MISTLISNAFWNRYEKQTAASQAEHRRTKEILAKTSYLSSHPQSIFYSKKF